MRGWSVLGSVPLMGSGVFVSLLLRNLGVLARLTTCEKRLTNNLPETKPYNTLPP